MLHKLKYEIIINYNNNKVTVLDKPSITFGELFNSISFNTKNMTPQDLIDKEITYRIYLDGSVVEEMFFVVTDYKEQIRFEGNTQSFTAYSKTYKMSKAYYGFLPNIEYDNLTQLINAINNEISVYGISIGIPFNYSLTNEDLPTEGKTISDILNSIANTLGIKFITNKRGDFVKPVFPKYTQNDITSYSIFPLNNLVMYKDISYTKGDDFNAIVISNLDIAGKITLETEQITDTSYYLYIYTSPLISTFEHVNVSSSDGQITRITSSESFLVEEFFNFTTQNSTVKYPIKTVINTEFYNLPNTLEWQEGSDAISISVEDDLCVGKIVYYTERAKFLITNLSEPYVKIKVEVFND